jgi:imidazoleglycerol-phosphate dehydratase/histidinol-phosphatase
MLNKFAVAFLDRDGALIFEPPDTQQVNGVEQLRILPGVVEGLQQLLLHDYRLVIVTNQDGLGTPSNPTDNFETVQAELFRRLLEEGIGFYEVFVCPHLKTDNCMCRKPRIGLIRAFLREEEIDYGKSLMVGDRDTDGLFANNIGPTGIRFFKMTTNGSFPKIPF